MNGDNPYGFIQNNENKIIFTIARMNPPTPGHLYLIRSLIQEALTNHVENVYIFLSKTNNNNENPIPCQKKVEVLGNNDQTTQTMITVEKQKLKDEYPESALIIDRINVHPICTIGDSPFDPLFKLMSTKKDVSNIELILIIGSDRVSMMDSIVGMFLLKYTNVQTVKGIILNRNEMEEYKNLPTEQLCNTDMVVPNDAMSASFVRNIVSKCPTTKEKFISIYSPYLSPLEIDELYDSIKSGLDLYPKIEKVKSKKTKKTVINPLKYEYTKEEFGDKTILIFTKEQADINSSDESQYKKQKKGGKRTKRKFKKNKRKYTKRNKRRY